MDVRCRSAIRNQFTVSGQSVSMKHSMRHPGIRLRAVFSSAQHYVTIKCSDDFTKYWADTIPRSLRNPHMRLPRHSLREHSTSHRSPFNTLCRPQWCVRSGSQVSLYGPITEYGTSGPSLLAVPVDNLAAGMHPDSSRRLDPSERISD